MGYTNDELNKILDTGIALSKEKDRNKLLDKILDESISIAHCDAGTLYVCRDDKLHFQVMKTLSMHVDKGKTGRRSICPRFPWCPRTSALTR